MFGLVFSAFPKPPNTKPPKHGGASRAAVSPLPLLWWRGAASSSLWVTSSRLQNVLPVPFATSRFPPETGTREDGARKELTASGPRESSYLQVCEIKPRTHLERWADKCVVFLFITVPPPPALAPLPLF